MMMIDFQSFIEKQPAVLDAIARAHANQWHPAAELRSNLDRLNECWNLGELDKAAQGLLAGDSIHNQGSMILDVIYSVFNPDPTLVAAAMRLAWQGGKIGFNFLPNPAETDPDEYDDAAERVLEALTGYGEIEAAALLLDDDQAFHNALPERFTVYRGGYGLPPERLAAGLCWTTRRDAAEWFSWRGIDQEPVVVSARVQKREISTVFSNECEIVCLPKRHRAIKCRRKSLGERPDMTSSPETDRQSTPAPVR